MLYREAIAAEHLAILNRDPKAIILGVGVNDGAKFIFGTTKLAAEKYPERVIETPLSETMLTGAIIGMAADGWHPTLVHARADFLYLSAEHLLNTAATWKMIHGTGCPITVRAIIGQGWGNGPMHTKAPLEMFNVPGLQILTPDCRPMLTLAMTHAERSGIPTIIFERRSLYDVPLIEDHWISRMNRPMTRCDHINWAIPRGPAPASRPLETAYYAAQTAGRQEAF